MKKNCKLFVAIVALFLVAFLFAACGNETPAATDCEKNGHTWNDGVVTKEANCTDKGVKTFACSVCEETKTEDIAALGHTEVVDAAVPATCTATGKTEGKHCSVCDTVLVEQTIVEKIAHTEVVDAAVPATCSAKGKTEGSHCSVCNEVIVAQNEIPTIAHTFIAGVEVEPTCTEEGKKAANRCSACGHVEGGEAIPALGHTFVKIPAVEATCTEQGRKAGRYCSVCAYKEPGKRTIMLNHVGIATPAVAATCTTDGHTEGKKCKYCDEWLDGSVITATGHDVVVDAAVPATCSSTGKTEGSHCSVCNEVLVAQTELAIDPESHVVTTVDAVAATCSTTGLTEGSSCSVCGIVFVAQTETPIDPENHVVVTDAAVPATCSATGKTEGSHCSACSAVIVAQTDTPIDPANHFGGTATTKALAVCDGCGVSYGNFAAYADIDFDNGEITDSQGKVGNFVNNNGSFTETEVTHGAVSAVANALVTSTGGYVDCYFTELDTSEKMQTFAEGGFTVEAFYVLSNKDSAQGVVCACANVGGVKGGWGLAEKNAGKPYFITGNGTAYHESDAVSAASTTQLVHVVGVFDYPNNIVKVYVNGIYAGSNAATEDVAGFAPLGGAGNFNKFCLGAGAGSTSFGSRGMVMVDAKIYETALGAAQITVAYNEAVAALGQN